MSVEVPDSEQYIGRTVTIDGKPVVIKKIAGSFVKTAFYEINGEHLIGMLRFHAQMTGDKSITEAQFREFENMQIEAERMDDEPKRLAGMM